jgi:hypothetical protein
VQNIAINVSITACGDAWWGLHDKFDGRLAPSQQARKNMPIVISDEHNEEKIHPVKG